MTKIWRRKMKNNRFMLTFIFFGLFSFLAVLAGAGDKYVKISQDRSDILTAPQAAATVVCTG